LRPTYRRCFVEIAGCLENRRWHVDRSPEIARRTVIPVVRNGGPVPDLVPRLRRRKTRQIRSRLGRVRPIMLQHGGPTREWANTVIAVTERITNFPRFTNSPPTYFCLLHNSIILLVLVGRVVKDMRSGES
jgi:hypothetical protein